MSSTGDMRSCEMGMAIVTTKALAGHVPPRKNRMNAGKTPVNRRDLAWRVISRKSPGRGRLPRWGAVTVAKCVAFAGNAESALLGLTGFAWIQAQGLDLSKQRARVNAQFPRGGGAVAFVPAQRIADQ